MVGLYLPPVFKYTPTYPPQTIISLPAHTTEQSCRPTGALMVLVAVQLSVPGLYLPPVFRYVGPLVPPPHTIISLPVQTAVWPARASGALVRLVGTHVSSVQPPNGLPITGSV